MAFPETGGVHDRKRSGKPGVSEECVETIRASFVRSPTKSTRPASRELLLPRSTIHKVLHNTQFFKTPSGLCGHTVYINLYSTSNIEILERFQSKAVRMIVDAHWYMLNTVIWRNLQTPTVKEEMLHYSSQYGARWGLVVNLMEQPDNRRLRRHLPNDLPTGFLA
jgi:hypothetical protein